MLGLKGVRLGLTRPEVYRMQIRSIARAIDAVRSEDGKPVAEVMIPLVGFPAELKLARQDAGAVLEEVLGADNGVPIGTMIELPRACDAADDIAEGADFFSFGTNDLTQTTCGLGGDDVEGSFLADYLRGGVLDENPFETLDHPDIGALVSMACVLGRGTNPGLKLGVCGEHGGDPRSVAFLREAGLDYVSCSPYRVPVARLAAAGAELERRDAGTRGASPEAGRRAAVTKK